MIQKEFAERVAKILSDDKTVIGLAVGGSWLTNELDEYSDLDLILVTQQKISGTKEKMLVYASKFGDLLSGFTGEHVGEPRVLICLYNNPLLHVDLKFLTLDEFRQRIETPYILLDTDRQLQNVLEQTESKFPYPDYQWIEDRFWTWIHYLLSKIGRGEFTEAIDFLGFLRMVVLGPLLHVKNGNLPRAVRKVETALPKRDLDLLSATIPVYSRSSLFESVGSAVSLYKQLRDELYSSDIVLDRRTEESVMTYFDEIRKT